MLAFSLFSLLCSAPAGPPEIIDDPPVTALAQALADGTLSSRALVERYQARIAALDPLLASVIELNPDALELADRADAARKGGAKAKSPLDGLPILIKDNVSTHDRMTTTAGSLALEGFIAPEDAEVVRRLREAGAIILGKTNLSEWANIRSSFSISGWSGRGGQTRNPYALDRSPIGSSSGSGAAIAANLAVVALGTETDGSVTMPASVSGLVGLKPTVGLVSRHAIIPISHSQDTAGPMARSVADAAALLDAIAGPDPRDPITLRAPSRASSYLAGLDAKALAGARVGVVRALFGKSPHSDRVAEEAIARMRTLGAVIIDPVEIPTIDKLGQDENEVLLYELKADLDDYFKRFGRGAKVHSLAELIAWNEAHADRELFWFGQDLLETAAKKGPLSNKAYQTSLTRSQRLARAEGIDRAMGQHHLDALFGPTSGPAGLIDPVAGDYGSFGASTLPAVAGYPHLTVPGGMVSGLPIGVSYFGRAYSEAKLLGIGYAFEQATHHRAPPKMLKTVALPPLKR